MRQITYNSASNVLRFEFPVEWNVEDLSGLTLAIHDKDNTELLAAQAVTLYTATELDGAAVHWQKLITLDSGAGALEPGDPIQIDGVSGSERHTVKGYNSTTYEATLRKVLRDNHADADTVYGLWGSYTLDTTTVATWTAGLIAVLTWTPTGTGQPTTAEIQIAKSSVQVEGLARRLEILFPRVYAAFTKKYNRMEGMLTEAKMQLQNDLELNNMDFERVVDQDAVSIALLYKMAVLWTEGADEDLSDERNHLMSQYEAKKAIILNLPIWTDQDQDGVEDEGEVEKHTPTFSQRMYR